LADRSPRDATGVEERKNGCGKKETEGLDAGWREKKICEAVVP
jgi:hypothetical protein